MALDNAPRKFVLIVNNSDMILNASKGHDHVTILLHGSLLPTTRRRIMKAIKEGNVELKTKVIM